MVGLLILCALAQTAPTPAELKQLQQDRQWLFDKTKDKPNSGYVRWGEGGRHDVFFPIGRSDRVYYFSHLPNQTKQSSRVVIACWQRKGGKVDRVWLVPFISTPDRRRPKGLLLRLAHEMAFEHEELSPKPKVVRVVGYRPDRKARDWTRAKTDLESEGPLALYHVAQHGDAALGTYAAVMYSDSSISRTGDATSHRSLGSGITEVTFPVFRICDAELNLLNKLKRRS